MSKSSYLPIQDEVLEESVNVSKQRRTKRSSTRKKRGGKGKAVVLLGLLVLAVVAVVLAIVLPIMLTGPTNPNAARSGLVVPSPTALVAADGTTIPPVSASPAAPVAGGATEQIFCYRTASGVLMQGGLRKTGTQRTSLNVLQDLVESCGSGNTFYVTSARLEACAETCATPIWLATSQGALTTPVWDQDFVCQGNQVFINTKTAQSSFYFRYGAVVRETLVTECDTDKGWFVPDQELRQCQKSESEACNAKNIARTTARSAQPSVVQVSDFGNVIRAGALCVSPNVDVAIKATGVVRSRFVWWRLMRVNEAQAHSCNGTALANEWVDVSTVVSCSDAARVSCP